MRPSLMGLLAPGPPARAGLPGLSLYGVPMWFTTVSRAGALAGALAFAASACPAPIFAASSAKPKLPKPKKPHVVKPKKPRGGTK